jgi:hypothetical protein
MISSLSKYAAFSEAWPAASPLAVRKGWAFPSCENITNLIRAAWKELSSRLDGWEKTTGSGP